MRPLLVLAALALPLVAGCGDDDGGASDASVAAVATTTQVADLVRNVGGVRVAVDGVLPVNADPHDYEPRPSDAAALADADVVFQSGGDLDAWLDELVDSAGGEAQRITLIDSVRKIEGGHGEHEEEEHAEEEHADEGTDPHWWQDPRNAMLAVEAIRDALIEADPGGRQGYERRADDYIRRLRSLDEEVARCIDRVPPAKRKLVTTHDALGYFADRYGLEVIGAVIPSLSTQAQPSARDVDDLVEQIREQGVEAIFPEAALSQKLESAVSGEAGAEVGGELYADTLGPEGSAGATYIGAMRSNAEALAEGMSGGRVRCGF